MLLNRSTLFVHINKAGGSTCTIAMAETARAQHLRKEVDGYHRTLDDMVLHLPRQIDASKLRIFTIVRNPWDRMVSHQQRQTLHKLTRSACAQVSMFHFYQRTREFEIGNRPFTNWTRHIYGPAWPRTRVHSAVNMLRFCFGNQLDWLGRGPHAQRVVILRFEQYDAVLDYLRRDLGIVVRREHANQGRHRPHTPFCRYYTAETRALVAEHYGRDLTELQYRFPSPCLERVAESEGQRSPQQASHASLERVFERLNDLTARVYKQEEDIKALQQENRKLRIEKTTRLANEMN